mgnify:CR=1 FL=1
MVYKVLIVDDDPMVAMINGQYVQKKEHFTVCGTCKNGQEALNYLEANKADLVILDVYMPIMDGVETLKQIREKKFDVEVIMVTAANDTNTLENTMHLGVIDYLIKPFAFERFQVALEQFEAKINAIKGAEVLDQSCIDNIMGSKKRIVQKDYPKGIQEKTLEKIQKYVESKDGWVDGECVAEDVGLSSVTVRHYMSYLVQTGFVKESINYETGGRPSLLYKKVK